MDQEIFELSDLSVDYLQLAQGQLQQFMDSEAYKVFEQMMNARRIIAVEDAIEFTPRNVAEQIQRDILIGTARAIKQMHNSLNELQETLSDTIELKQKQTNTN